MEFSGKLSNALNPKGLFKSMRGLLVDFAEIHVRSKMAGKKELKMTKMEEEKLKEVMDKIEQNLNQVS